jgi:hypothetical protein
LSENLASSCERLDEDGFLIGDRAWYGVEIFEWQCKEFGERAVVSYDSEHFAAGAVGLEAAAAKFAGAPESERCTGDIDFAGDTAVQPAFLRAASNASNVHHFTDEFVAGRSAKIVITAKDFDVGVADACEADAHESPAAVEGWQRLADGG